MNLRMTAVLLTALTGVWSAVTYALEPSPPPGRVSADVPSRLTMVSERDGPEGSLSLRGTSMAAEAEGALRVEFRNGEARMVARVAGLPEPATLGPYALYVLWSLTPDGCATNEGVIAGGVGGKGRRTVDVDAREFAVIVTAEPHFAVTSPSPTVALYGVVDEARGGEPTVGVPHERDYSRLPRPPYNGAQSPLMIQARYSIAIARVAGAERYAADAFLSANRKLAAAETAAYAQARATRGTALPLARAAVIEGENARRIAASVFTTAATQSAQPAAHAGATRLATEAAAAPVDLVAPQTIATSRDCAP
ncbi:MAG TPA: hypothetical protein VHH11_20235 [Gammaproteobacteria bacterium]|jgi:hypothetical protein|nr:hypothetical protein [Gammaproteobacteria bacterium]